MTEFNVYIHVIIKQGKKSLTSFLLFGKGTLVYLKATLLFFSLFAHVSLGVSKMNGE
jgi:hypothetical protein